MLKGQENEELKLPPQTEKSYNNFADSRFHPTTYRRRLRHLSN